MGLIRVFTVLVLSLAGCLAHASDTIWFKQQSLNMPIASIQNGWTETLQLPFITHQVDTLQNIMYHNISNTAFGKTLSAGEPELPISSKLFSVPIGVVPTLLYNVLVCDTFSLPGLSVNAPIMPSAGSVQKTDDSVVRSIPKGPKYEVDAYLQAQPVSLKFHGTMRGTDVYELIYAPIAYNPVKASLIASSYVQVSIQFNHQSDWLTQWQPYNIKQNAFLKSNPSRAKEAPETYIIVSFPEFDSILAPFIKWKSQQGFRVHVANIGQQIGNASKTEIKSYLETWYKTPPTGFESPTYVLLIGDVDRIGAWPGQTDTHATDLPYAEYTGDFLPEVFIGRFSAKNANELTAIVEKNLIVQQQKGSTSEFQNRHLLISGVDAGYAPIYGNGAINYFTSNYSNSQNGVDARYYLYGAGSPVVSNSQGARDAILSDFSAGNGTVYYTAHCSASGWSNPVFNIADVVTLTNYQMYPVVTGNCCHSLAFGGDSFGEQLVKAKDKGAVAYIGASDYSYWDEDYYWAIGYTKPIVANPTYQTTGLGAWDAWWHLNNEPEANQANHIGEYLWFGNMAVMASASTLKNYYWEIYNLMGDPSLVPAKKQYNVVPHAPISAMTGGQTQLMVETVSGSMVTIFQNSNISAIAKADANGIAYLNFEPLAQIGLNRVEFVISHPDFAPFMDTLDVIAPNMPFLIFENAIVNDSESNNNALADYGESFILNLKLTNYGTLPAKNILINLACADAGIKSWSLHSDSAIVAINPGESINTDYLASVSLKNNLPNNHKLRFEGSISYSDSLVLPLLFTLTVNAPELIVSNVVSDAAGIGNLDGYLSAGENATLTVSISNIGLAQVSNTVLQLNSSADTALVVQTQQLPVGDLLATETKTQYLNILVADSIFPGSEVDLNYSLVSGLEGQYLFTGSVAVKLGKEPEIKMSNESHVVASAKFYDSGGPNGKYSHKESYAKTFTPYKKDYGISVEFSEFDVESSNSGICFDKLLVYDGPTSASPLIGTFCNANKPKSIYSQNSTGALTFRFISDGDVLKNGWSAQVTAQPHRTVNFLVYGSSGVLANAEVKLLNQVFKTDSAGLASFNFIPQSNSKPYQITHPTYFEFAGTLGSINSDTLIEVFMTRLPKISFTVISENNPVKDAKVVLNNNTFFTDSLGLVTYNGIQPGYYTYSITKKGLTDTAGTIAVENLDVNSVFNLSKLPIFNILFKVTDSHKNPISNATIHIHDTVLTTNEVGESSLTKLTPNWYIYTVMSSGFLPLNGELLIDTAHVVKECVLNQISYSVEFSVQYQNNPVAQALIVLSDTSIITNNMGLSQITDLPGNYESEFQVVASGFAPYFDNIILSNANQLKVIELAPLTVLNSHSESLNVYPNPSKFGQEVSIYSREPISNITIMDLSGKVTSVNNTPLISSISVKDLPLGISVISIQTQTSVFKVKILTIP